MKRIFLLIALFLMAAKFAALSIEPYGDSVYDLASGITILPQGGVIHDNENNLSIDASYIEYKDSEYIKAKKARLQAEGVRFAAAELEYLPASDEARLAGGLSFDTEDIKGLEAQNGWIFLKDGVAVLQGEVVAKDPEFSSSMLVADYRQGRVLLLAPYKYKDEQMGVVLTGKNPKKPLYIEFHKETGRITASSKAPPEVVERLLAYVQRVEVDK